MDTTHSQNLTPSITFQKVGLIMQRPVHWHRLPFQGPSNLSDIMAAAGLTGIEIRLLSQVGDDSEIL